MLKYIIFNHAGTWVFMGAKVVFSQHPFPPFFQRHRILRQGAIDLALKIENIKNRRNMYVVSVVKYFIALLIFYFKIIYLANSLIGCFSNKSNTVIKWFTFIFIEHFIKKIFESPWNNQTKMIHDNYNDMQIDFMERTYIHISTRSIQKLYDIKATLTKLKPKSLSVIDTYWFLGHFKV